MDPFGDETPEQVQDDDFAKIFEESFVEPTRLTPGQSLEVTVVKISADWIFVDSGRKGEGVLDKKEFLDKEGQLKVAEGDRIKAYFLTSEGGELRFTTKVGEGKQDTAHLEEAWRSAIPVEGVVEKEIKGGYDVKIGGNFRAFCPFSQISLRRLANPAEIIGQRLSFHISQFTEKGRNIVVSRRAILEEEALQRQEELKASLQEGMMVQGTVTSLREFGAFIEAGGIEGLLPISEMGWGRIEDPAEILTVGQTVAVTIKSLDWDKGRFSFSLKQAQTDPWGAVAQKYPEGSFHFGKVSRLATFGAFVTLEEGVDGLIHISRLGGGKRINHPREAVREGETVEVRVEAVDGTARRLSLVLAEASREAEESEQTLADFRRRTQAESPVAMGTLGDLLRAKLEKKP